MKSPLESMSETQWSAFIRKTCHDVRTPLTTLQGYSELTLKKPSVELAQRVSLQALRSVFEIEIFISLLSSRERKMLFSLEEVSFETVLNEAVIWVQLHYEIGRFQFVPLGTTHTCILDRKKTIQAFIALLLEFAQESNSTDQIQIRLRRRGTSITLSISSAGPLLHREELKDGELPYRLLFVHQVLHAHRAKMKHKDSTWEVTFPTTTKPSEV